MNNNCDCSGSNVINNLLQNPNNSISNLGTNMGGNVGQGNLGGMDSMGFNLGMDYGNTQPVNNVTNYGNVGNNTGQTYGNNSQQPSNDGTRSTSINALRTQKCSRSLPPPDTPPTPPMLRTPATGSHPFAAATAALSPAPCTAHPPL